ncbi:unnamed protein product [Mortierella alpina]
MLREMADKKAGDVVKKPKPLPGQTEAQFRKSQGEELKITELNRTRLPRDVLSKSALELRAKLSLADSFTSVTIKNIQGADTSNNISIWREVVETQCDGLWDAALLKVERGLKAARSNQPSSSKPFGSGRGPPAAGTEEGEDIVEEEVDKEKENLRTCTVTLRSVVRRDIVQHMDSIVEALEKKQLLVTDDIADLAALANMAVLRIASGDAFGEEWLATADKTLDIMDLLPSGFQPRCAMSSRIDVAPIPEMFQASLEQAIDNNTDSQELLDAAGLLSQDFLQYLHTRFLGPRGTSQEAKNKHPLWERIASAIEASLAFGRVKLQGLSATLNEAVREFTTAINNLWEGSIKKKSLDYLLRILLRLHLAPLREQKTRDLKHRRAKEKKEALDNKKSREAAASTSRTQRKRWLSKTVDLMDQLSDVFESARDEVVRRRAPILLALITEHQRRMPRAGEQTRLPTIEETLKSAAESQESQAVREVQEHVTQTGAPCPQGVHEHTTDDTGYDSDDEDRDSVFGVEATVLEPRAVVAKKEPSSARLKALQCVLRTLVESDTGDELIDRAWVRKKGFRGTDFGDDECDVVLKIGRLLGPFVPKRRPATDDGKTRDAIPHVALRAPLAFIANSVLRLTGYSEFTRRLSPHISVGSVHALNLGAVGIYEVLSGGGGLFDIKDRHGTYLTSAKAITADPLNKRAVFGAIFDMATIEQICVKHGLVFRDRISYVDRNTVRILGRVIPHGPSRDGHPVASSLEKRKRTRRGTSGGHSKWMRILAGLNMDRKAIGDKAEDFKNQKKQLEAQIKAPRKRLATLRAAQTMARRDSNRTGTKSAYIALQEARRVVREV